MPTRRTVYRANAKYRTAEGIVPVLWFVPAVSVRSRCFLSFEHAACDTPDALSKAGSRKRVSQITSTPKGMGLSTPKMQVLCASSDEAVEPLAVPEGAPNGERVRVAGFDGEPEAQLPPKKKILEALMPDMATSAGAVSILLRLID